MIKSNQEFVSRLLLLYNVKRDPSDLTDRCDYDLYHDDGYLLPVYIKYWPSSDQLTVMHAADSEISQIAQSPGEHSPQEAWDIMVSWIEGTEN